MTDEDYTGGSAIAPTDYSMNITKSGRLRNPPIRKILEEHIAEFERELEARRNLIKKLDENKNTEELLDALRKVGI